MAAFNLEHEQRRLKEADINPAVQQDALRVQIRALLAERTKTLSPFELRTQQEGVFAAGFEHRGDLSSSYEKSVEEASSDEIAERFKLENDGYENVKGMFFSLPIGSTIMLSSPPPKTAIAGYADDSLTYFYHILPGEDATKRTIKAISWMNNFSNEEHAAILNAVTGSQKVIPTESSILLSPVGASEFLQGTSSFRTLWEKVGDVYSQKPRTFSFPSFPIVEQYLLHGDEIWEKQHQELALMSASLAQRIINGENAAVLHDDWNIMLNLADKKLVDTTHMYISPRRERLPQSPHSGIIFDNYRDLRYAPRVVATYCGLSGELGSPSSMMTDSGFSSFTFTVELPGALQSKEGGKTLNCKCPFCNMQVDAIIKDGKIKCPREACGRYVPYNC